MQIIIYAYLIMKNDKYITQVYKLFNKNKLSLLKNNINIAICYKSLKQINTSTTNH